MEHQLSRFAEITEQVYEYTIFDQHRLEVLGKVRRMIGTKPKDAILRYLKANSVLFRVSKRERVKAEERIKLMELGVHVRDWRRIDYLIGHYGWLYRFISNEMKEKALQKIDFLELFIKANKPRFIFEELKKTGDGYINAGEFEKAVVAFETRDFQTAKIGFEKARDELKKIVYPA